MCIHLRGTDGRVTATGAAAAADTGALLLAALLLLLTARVVALARLLVSWPLRLAALCSHGTEKRPVVKYCNATNATAPIDKKTEPAQAHF